MNELKTTFLESFQQKLCFVRTHILTNVFRFKMFQNLNFVILLVYNLALPYFGHCSITCQFFARRFNTASAFSPIFLMLSYIYAAFTHAGLTTMYLKKILNKSIFVL